MSCADNRVKGLHLLVICGFLGLTNCSYLGYYQYEKTVRAPAAMAAEVQFPNAWNGDVHLEGKMTRALVVAMNDLLPPGTRLKGDNRRVAWCLSRWETYDISVQRASDDLFFIYFSPILARCGLDDSVIVDAGTEYAIDGQGRILDVR
jgi:hypothetical protein